MYESSGTFMLNIMVKEVTKYKAPNNKIPINYSPKYIHNAQEILFVI